MPPPSAMHGNVQSSTKIILLAAWTYVVIKVNTVVSHKYVPPFAILALVQNAGGLYAGCDNFSRDYALPSSKA